MSKNLALKIHCSEQTKEALEEDQNAGFVLEERGLVQIKVGSKKIKKKF